MPVAAISVRLKSTRCVQSLGEEMLLEEPEVQAPGNSRCEGTNVHGHAVTSGVLLRRRPGNGASATITRYRSSRMQPQRRTRNRVALLPLPLSLMGGS